MKLYGEPYLVLYRMQGRRSRQACNGQGDGTRSRALVPLVSGERLLFGGSAPGSGETASDFDDEVAVA